MKKTLRQYQLGVILSSLKEHPSPKYFLEQYSITPGIAAEVLFLAKKDIKSKVVFDLGCGTGRFAIGAALLGAKEVCGVDMDQHALDVAMMNATMSERDTSMPITKICRWIRSDVESLDASCDTVVQFPPFARDKVFLKKALEISENIYSLHRATPKTKKELEKICKEAKAKIIKTKEFPYYIPWEEEGKIGRKILLVIIKK
ncbi:MAG: 50S ribosomal protein L11 methyltransferase [Candidatus Aenigmarchaeota archaeon]|nr:50S ribosomal protein L11 methyltransferase [Candidatus Aenigmarchaeota archaeon]